jgi:hypothetical protein
MEMLVPAADSFNDRSRLEGWEQLCDPLLSFEHPDFASVIALWKAQAHGRAMPARSDMTARVLKEFLPRVAMKERMQTNPSRYRWRLVGTKVAEVLGERTGKFADEDAPPKQVARWNMSCDLVLETRLPMRFTGRVLANNRDYMQSDLLFMPLADENGTPKFVMGFGLYTAVQPAMPAKARAAAGARI